MAPDADRSSAGSPAPGPPSSESAPDRLRIAALVWVAALTYAVTVAAVATLVAVVVGVATGGGLVRAKVLLFVAGFLLLTYATVRLWPSSPSDLESDATDDPTGQSLPADADATRFQAFVRSLPPLRWLEPPPPTRRLSPASKLFVGSLLVLLVSYLMESAFGIA